MPPTRKDSRRKVRDGRVRKTVRKPQKSPSMGDTVTVANPEPYAVPSPMDLDEEPCVAATEESAPPQPSPSPAPPDLTQRQSEASWGNDGEEHARRGGGEQAVTAIPTAMEDTVGGDLRGRAGGGGEQEVTAIPTAMEDTVGGDLRGRAGGGGEQAVTAILTARDDTVGGDLRGRAASAPTQGYAQARPPGPPTAHTTGAPADLDNGFDNEIWRNRIEKQLLKLTIQSEESVARHDKQEAQQAKTDKRQNSLEARQNEQSEALKDHETRLNRHDAHFQSLRDDIKDIRLLLENQQDSRQNEEADRKKEKAQKEARRKHNEERDNNNQKWLKQLMADVAVLRRGGNEHTQSDSGPPATPTAPASMPPTAISQSGTTNPYPQGRTLRSMTKTGAH